MPDTPLTDEQLAAIRTRRHLATGGTWYLQPKHGPNFVAAEYHGYEHGIGDLAFGDGDQADADREFVLNAHDDVTALLTELDRSRAEIATTNARIAAVLALTTASDEELEQMDPEQYHQAVGCDTAITDIQRMLVARES